MSDFDFSKVKKNTSSFPVQPKLFRQERHGFFKMNTIEKWHTLLLCKNYKLLFFTSEPFQSRKGLIFYGTFQAGASQAQFFNFCPAEKVSEFKSVWS
jgi:hypothetical protein